MELVLQYLPAPTFQLRCWFGNNDQTTHAVDSWHQDCPYHDMIYNNGLDTTQLHLVILPYPPTCYQPSRSEEHTSELQSRPHLVCRLLLEKKKKKKKKTTLI